MVRFLTAFIISLSLVSAPVTARAAYLPGVGVGTITVGGMPLSTTNLFILHCNIGANSYSVCYNASLGGSPAVYQVTTGKTFKLYAIRCDQSTAAASSNAYRLIYGDTNVGVNSSSAPTNPVGVISGVSSGNAADDTFSTNVIAGTSTMKERAVGGSVPASKYVYVNGTNGPCDLFGYEI